MQGGAPASAGGSGQNGTVYTPAQQPQADANFLSTLQPLIDLSANGGAGTPGGWAYPQAQSVYGNRIDPFGYAANLAANATYDNYNHWNASQYPQQNASSQALYGAGNQAISQGGNLFGLGNKAAGVGDQMAGLTKQITSAAFDPQNALFNRTQQQLLDQSNAVNSMSGVAGTPYGSSVTSNALGNMDVNWQNNQLNRQLQGETAATNALKGADSAYATAGALGTQGGALLGQGGSLFGQAAGLGNNAANTANALSGTPYNTAAAIGSNALSALGSTTNLGNNQFLLPQQVLNDLESYLNLGQSASGLSGSLGQLGFNQTAQGLGGIGSALGGANSLLGGNGLFSSNGAFGSNGALGGLGSAGGLFGSQGALFGTAADASIAAGGPPLAAALPSAALSA